MIESALARAGLGSVEKLAVHHDATAFDCGRHDLNQFLQRFALPSQQANSSQTYVVCRNRRIVGYYSLVAMHGVRAELVQAQADAAGLPLWPVPLPWPCSNDEYEARMRAVVGTARAAGVTAFAFGDLFLADIRAYRERQLAGTGIDPLFPVWGTADDTPALARAMIAGGLRATLACVDPRQLPPAFAGRAFDSTLLADLPPGVDPCGERGEFHTFCHAGPVFASPIRVQAGEVVERDGFWFADLIPGEGGTR